MYSTLWVVVYSLTFLHRRYLESETDPRDSETSESQSALPGAAITPVPAAAISATAGVMLAAVAIVSVPISESITPLPSKAAPDTLARLGLGVTDSVTPLGVTDLQALAPVVVDPLVSTTQTVEPAPSVAGPSAPLIAKPVKKETKMVPSKTSKTPRCDCFQSSHFVADIIYP